MSEALFMQPDWVMLGVKVPDSMPQPEGMECPRVMVIASQTLTHAELRAALEHHGWDLGSMRAGSLSKSFEIQAFMRDVVMAYGADYADAMRTIFERWSPDASARNNREGLHNIRPASIGSGPAELMP